MARRYGQDDSDAPAPRNDVYTGLLAVSFFAMLTGCLLLILDWYSYPDARPKGVSVVPAAGSAKPAKRAQPPEVKKEEPKKVEEEKKEELKKEEMKKEELKKEEMKKEEMKKEEKDAEKKDAEKKDAEKKDAEKKDAEKKEEK